MMAPPKIVDYVVSPMNQLTFIHPHHTEAFWNEIDKGYA